MSMHLQTAKIISPPAARHWSQVFIKDGFLIVIKITEEEEAVLKGREIIARLQEYYVQTKGRLLKKLTVVLERLQKETRGIKLELILGVVFKNVLYLGVLHQGRVVLLRDGQLATILQGENGIVTCSGFLKVGDVFVLGTRRFFESVTDEVLKSHLEKKEPEAVVEVLAPLIHETQDGGAAAVLVRVFQERKTLTLLKPTKLGIDFRRGLLRLKEKVMLLFRPYEEKGGLKEQRMMVTVAGALAVLLIVSVIFGWQKRRKVEEKRKFQQIWEEIDYKYQEGKELASVNPILAKKLLRESLKLAEANDNYPQIRKLSQEIIRELEKVKKEYQLTAVPVFLDLNLVKENLKAVASDSWQEKTVILGEDGTVVVIDLSKKAAIKGKVEEARLVTLWGEKIFVLNKKIVAVGEEITIERDWDEVIGIESFAGNLYLLDKTGEIWKYPVIETGFGSRRRWFGPGVQLDLSQAVDWAIDGDIWILFRDGQIKKFSRGVAQTFALAGLDKELSQPVALYTDEDSKHLYLLDQGSRRVVVLLKNGEYESQYLWEGLEKINNLIVNERERKMLLLSEDKIYEIELR